jgi:ribonuclease P protein component
MTSPFINLNFRFSKKERLNSRQQIEALFANGKRISAGNIRLVYRITDESNQAYAQVMISVPKKSFKKAVHRNLIKRRIREAYRLNKHDLIEHLIKINMHLVFAFLYTSQDIHEYKIIQADVVNLLNKLALKLTLK